MVAALDNENEEVTAFPAVDADTLVNCVPSPENAPKKVCPYMFVEQTKPTGLTYKLETPPPIPLAEKLRNAPWLEPVVIVIELLNTELVWLVQFVAQLEETAWLEVPNKPLEVIALADKLFRVSNLVSGLY